MAKLTDKEILDFVRENLTLDKEFNTNVVLLDEVRCTIRGDIIGDVWGDIKGEVLGDVAGNVRGNVNGKIKMTKDEILKLALEALANGKKVREGEGGTKSQPALEDAAISSIEEALAQTEQEPVAWANIQEEAQQIVESKFLWKKFIVGTPLSNDIACWMADFAQQYTTPPQPEPFAPDWVNYRQGKIDGAQEGCEWVELTDEGISDISGDYKSQYNHGGITFDEFDAIGFARAIEAALKEK
tara:strand:- start:138 stop:863 length:726 start_codon:yes stop_codon:yes gene_type:complete